MGKIFENGTPQITQGYGVNGHLGVDLINADGFVPNIVSKADGVIIICQDGIDNEKGSTGNRSYGNFVKIQHADGYCTLYAHMEKGLKVKKGQSVVENQVIGIMGNSGNSYGRHLHFEVWKDGKRINPESYIFNDLPISKGIEYRVHLKNGSWLEWVSKVDETDNGYAGIYGREIDGVQVCNKSYRVHLLGNNWLSTINKVDNTSDGYAGIYGNSIDGLQVENAIYRVHVKTKGSLKSEWLPWVNKVDNTNEGYAGYYGREIDGIQIKNS